MSNYTKIFGRIRGSDEFTPIYADSNGNLSMGVAGAASSSVTSVNDSATSAQLLAANTSRRGATIYNDSTSILYVKFGTTASATDFTVKIQPDGYFEFPMPVYTGRVDGIWSADASGAARITEVS